MHEVLISSEQRAALQAITKRQREDAGLVRRARIILLAADGVPSVEIASKLDITPEAVSRIRKRFIQGGVDALYERKKAGRKDHALSAETIENIIQLALSPPPPGRSHCRLLRLVARAGQRGCSRVVSGSRAALSRTCCARGASNHTSSEPTK